MLMKKILFYTANGVGLGHLRRASLIAEEIKKNNKGTKIGLATMADNPLFFGRFFDYSVKLKALSDKLLNSPASFEKVRLDNSLKFAEFIKGFKPDLVIADFYLTSSFTFSIFKYGLDSFPVKSIFIWRLNDKQKFKNNFNNKNHRLDYFQKIILPHNPDELKSLLSTLIFKKIKNNKKFSITGPIFKKINKLKLSSCRKKHRISHNDYFLLVSFGGGGELKKGGCDSPEKILKYFLNIYPKLIKKIPNLKTIIITGPYFRKFKQPFLSRLKVIKFEKELPELFRAADLVVSLAGYNTCNELIQARTPAVLIPLTRGDKEQFERADYFEKKGIAVKIRGNLSGGKLLNSNLYSKDRLKEMKGNFNNFVGWKRTNHKLVKEILDFLE